MSAEDRRDAEPLERNLARLLALAEPPTRMPEAVRTRIGTRLLELCEPEPAAAGAEARALHRVEPRRLLLWAAAAAAVVAVALLGTWPGGVPAGVSWAEVLERLAEVRSVTARITTEVVTDGQAGPAQSARIAFADPGRSRTEVERVADPAAGALAGLGPRTTLITHWRPGGAEQLILRPDERVAVRMSHVFLPGDTGHHPSVDAVAEAWQRLAGVVAVPSRRCGEREIGGRRAVGFEVPAAELFGERRSAASDATLRVWADDRDGTPLELDLAFRDPAGAIYHTVVGDIVWNAPVADEKFALTAPPGWQLQEVRREAVELRSATLAPWVVLEVRADRTGEVVATETDVVAVRRGESIDDLRQPVGPRITLELELTPAASARLFSVTSRTPADVPVAEFDRETRAVVQSAPDHGVLIDVSRLGPGLAEVLERYVETGPAVPPGPRAGEG